MILKIASISGTKYPYFALRGNQIRNMGVGGGRHMQMILICIIIFFYPGQAVEETDNLKRGRAEG